MSQLVDDLYNLLQQRAQAGYVRNGVGIPSLSKDDLSSIEAVANYFGFNPVWLVNLINIESAGTFNPSITNNIGATGLIQFLPSTAISLGTTTNALRAMTFPQQMDYVRSYIYNTLKNLNVISASNTIVPDWFTFRDLCMTIFYPAAVGNPDYIMPSYVTALNPSVRTAQDYVDHAMSMAILQDIYTMKETATLVVSVVKKNIVVVVAAALLFTMGIIGLIYTKNKKQTI